jgi:hypothetical protein
MINITCATIVEIAKMNHTGTAELVATISAQTVLKKKVFCLFQALQNAKITII